MTVTFARLGNTNCDAQKSKAIKYYCCLDSLQPLHFLLLPSLSHMCGALGCACGTLTLRTLTHRTMSHRAL